jgi:hypothetical protein
MSVPAHAHLDEHGLNPDSYEDYVGGAGDPYNVWNATNAGPAVVLPAPTDQLVHFLMYTMQEQADHFGSNGPADGNGNDNIGGDATPAERDFLNAIDLGSLGGPTTDAGPWSLANLNIIRDKTLPYAIRATAGLLYWFCVTTGLIPPIVSVASGRDESGSGEFHLAQNYPNPFNPKTGIRFQIPPARQEGSRGAGGDFGWVKLAVFDLLGREVAILVNERKAPGRYEVTFDASSLASGTYIYRMQAGTFIQSRTLLLLR